jgi:hypothetical protein
MLGVVYDVDPLDSADPPVDAAYQSMVMFAGTVAESTTVPVPQRDAFIGEVGADGVDG